MIASPDHHITRENAFQSIRAMFGSQNLNANILNGRKEILKG
jgi:hypothetical protein